jgi:hypothetical protein
MTNTQQFFGNYLGVVIQNNDPEKRGRVKVFVPHISYNLYENWSKDDADKIDKVFTNLQDESLSKVLAELKDVLPWAEVAAPLFGGNASGRFFSPDKSVIASHSSVWDHEQEQIVQGNRPAARFTGPGSLHDGFNDGTKTDIMNPYTFEYTPSDYSNLAAGTFTVPNVGAHVWVFFEGGDSGAPVYWASSYSQADFKRIYTTVKFTDEALAPLGEEAVRAANISVDYPSDFENSNSSEKTPEAKTFRSKHVINTNKHVIELIDTDHREILKLTHFSGSFKEWNNFSTVEFACNNDQKLVMGDQFETVRKSKNTLVTGHNRQYTEGDSFVRIGNFDFESVKQVKEIVSDINKYKQLFDTKRIGRRVIGYRGATTQLSSIVAATNMSELQTQDPLFSGTGLYDFGHVQCPRCKNEQYSPKDYEWTMGFVYNIDPLSSVAIVRQILPTESAIYSPLQQMRSATALPGAPPGKGFFRGGLCDVCSSEYMERRLRRPGYNPSTEHGRFKIEDRKTPGGLMYQKYQQKRQELNKLLSTLVGGDQIVEIQKNKIETIGMVINDSASCRVDPIGRLRVESVTVAPEGLYVSGKPSPHVEVVDTSETPGGNYIVTAGNKLKFIVGSKGINMKTFGPIDIYGSILNITGESINFGCQNDINFTAQEKLLIRARKTVITSKDHEPVLIESPLHVTRNTIIQGGLYVDGEVGFQHICSLREYGYSSSSVLAPGFISSVQPQTPQAGAPQAGALSVDKDISLLRALKGLSDSEPPPLVSVPSQRVESKFWGVVLGAAGIVTGAIGIGLSLAAQSRAAVNAAKIAALEATVKRMQSDIQILFQQLVIVEEFGYNHQHLYERMPIKFFDSAVALRGYLNDPSEHAQGATINSRNLLLSAQAVTPFTGAATGIVGQALAAIGAQGRIQAAVTAFYTGQGASTVVVNPIQVAATELTPDRTSASGTFVVVASVTRPPAPGVIPVFTVTLNFQIVGIATTPLEGGGAQYSGGGIIQYIRGTASPGGVAPTGLSV